MAAPATPAPSFDDRTEVDPPAAAPAAKKPARTMFGMPAMALPSGAGAASPPVDPDPSAAGIAAAAAEGSPNATASPAAAPAAKKPPRARTMLGMAAVPLPAAAPSTSASAAAAEAPPEPTPAQAPRGHVPAAVSNRTMLGVAVAPPQPQASASPQAPRGPAAVSNRTMLGMPARSAPAAAAAPAPASQPPRRRAAVAEGSLSDVSIPGLPRRRRALPILLFAAFAVCALVLGAGAVYWATRGPTVRASLVTTDAGERLRIEVPGAPEGSAVSVAGARAQLQQGVAELPLTTEALSIGENRLAVSVIAADGSADEVEVVLELRYRVRPELAGLAEDSPHVSLVVDAQPGASVEVEGQPLALDASGHGRLDVPVEGGDSARLERTFRYRIVPPEGTPVDGQVRVALPYVQLQVDRPGTHLVTDRSEVEVAGLVAQGATLTLDGEPVEVHDGHFVTTLTLPELGDRRAVLVARQPERAPRRVTLELRRVADLAAEAAAYAVDRRLTYARIADGPESYRGQHVAFEGRVYNVRVAAGHSDLQMLVRSCARGRRCPLWVSYPAATSASRDQWVRVVGEVAGEQQFRAESGQVLRVPKVEAVFVLPVAP